MNFKVPFLLLSVLLCYAHSSTAQKDSTDTNYTYFYYDNGEISSEGVLLDGKPQGLWKTYYENGQLKTIGSRKNSELQDEWYFYRENGNLERMITYQEGIKSGLEHIFTVEGILNIEYTYVNGKKNGVAYYYYADGTVKKEVPFIEDKEEGKGVEYGTDGRIITFLTYRNGYLQFKESVNRYNREGLKTGRWIELFSNSSKVHEEGNYSNGKRNGLFKVYNRRGDLERIETYKNGVLQEDTASEILKLKKELGTDGKVKAIGSYANGKKQGIFREYDDEGNIASSAIYKDGVKVGEGIITGSGQYEGSWKLFFPTGEIKAEGKYEDGEKNGVWKYYYQTGQLEQRGNYKNSLASGEWLWYFPNGELKRQEYYRKGREDGESIEYAIDGKIINRGMYVDGLRTGDWFLTVGDHEDNGEFIDDEKNGVWKSYYTGNKQLYFKGEYSLGAPVGKHEYFYSNGITKAEGKHQAGERHGDWKFYNTDASIELLIKYENGVEVRLNGEKIQ